MAGKPPFEIVETSMGVMSIKDNATGEIMHNPVGPWKEANSLYVQQSGLRHRLVSAAPDPLVLFDVGLGAAFNSLASVAEYEVTERTHAPHRPRPLHIVSFEKDLRLLEFTKNNIKKFPDIAPYLPLINQLLSNGDLTTPNGIRWSIRGGPFERAILRETAIPEIIYFDPYSPKVNEEMWTLETFEALYRLASQCSTSCSLMTYSASTGARTALLISGFFVGLGMGSGQKIETTFAATRLEEVLNPLEAAWLDRWRKSNAPLPPRCKLTLEQVEKRLLAHRQWFPR